MPAKPGDLYVSVPEPALKRAIRRIAYETGRPIRQIVRQALITGLVADGYATEPELVTRDTATHEPIPA